MTTGGKPKQTSVLVFLGHGQGDENWEERIRRGEANNPGPYGYANARDRLDVVYARSGQENRFTKVCRVGLKYALGFDLVHAVRNRADLRAADIVWTHTEKEHLALSVLKLAGVLGKTKPVIAQSVWLWGWLPTAGPVRRAITLSLLHQNQLHTVLAADGVSIGKDFLGEAVTLVPYGVRVTEVPAPHARQPRPVVIAPGHDKDRDWDTLGRAAALCPDIDFIVLSKRKAAKRLKRLGNVKVRQAADQTQMAREYIDCDSVVVPVKQNPHASGATTVLQAIGFERPVVVTRIGGIELYGGATAFYCATGDAASLAAAVRRALAQGTAEHCRQGRKDMLARGLTEEDYAMRHVLITEDYFGGQSPRAAVSKDACLVNV